MQPQLEAMPDQVIDDARVQAENTESSMLSQSAAILNGNIYQELGQNKSSIQTTYIVIAGMKMLALSLAGGIASILVCLLASRIAAGVSRNLRRDVFRKVTSFSNNEFDEFTTSSLITRYYQRYYTDSIIVGNGYQDDMLCPCYGRGRYCYGW